MKIKSILAAALLVFSVSATASTGFRMMFGPDGSSADVTATNPLPINPTIGGAAVSSSNPLPTAITNALSAPVNVQNIIGGAAITTANPLPIASQGTAVVLQVAHAANLVTGQATAAGATTIGTPPANSNMRLLHVEIPGNAIQATAGDDLITIALNGVTVATLDPYIPAASLGTGTLYTTVYNFDPIAFNTGSAGALTITLATALTAGAVNINAYFD